MQLRLIKDKIAAKYFLVLTILSAALVVVIGIGLYVKSAPIIHSNGLSSILFSSDWKPFKAAFGFLPFIAGTLWVTAIAIIIAVPVSIFTAVYLSEYAHVNLKRIILPLIDLLSGIPPIIYGVWGTLVIVPFIQNNLATHFVEYSSGYSALAAGIVLAIMTIPLIISILIEVFALVPNELRDVSASLGATGWKTIKSVVLRKAFPGIIAAVILAISRALGETIAVLMVCGNTPLIPHSIFDACYPLPALIANNYGEMLSVPLYDSALMLAAFILFIIIVIFNTVSRIILYRLEKKNS